ncbi:MAG TPA: S9 family peptidase [Xanthomonadaceae bacterium]|nr:S9 family peptidase [Xanthomonadaceae bacterium]
MHPRRIALATALSLALATPLAIAETTAAPGSAELITREALFGNPSRANVQVSPDGKYISWIAPVDNVLNVFVAPAGDLDKARAVTDDKARGIRQYFWSYRPDTLLYVRDTGGDEDFHLFSVDLASGTKRDLTPYEKTRAFVVGVSHGQPDSVMVGMNDRDASWHDLYRVDLASGERTLVEKNDKELAGYMVDSDYKVRYAFKSRPDGGQDVLVPDGEGGWKLDETIPFGDSLTTQVVGMSHDGKTLYWVDSRGRNTAAAYAEDIATGKRKLIFEDPRADVGDALIHPRTGKVQAVASDYLREQWQVVDAAVKDDLAKLEGMGPGEASVTSRTLDDKTWIVAYSAASEPATYFRYDNENNTLTKLFVARPELEGKPLMEMHPLEIKARDGMTLVSYLTLPPGADQDQDGKADRPVPMVLFVHGGPWARDSYGYSAYEQWLANRGYAVLNVNYRGSSGFGKQFINAADQQWAGKMHDDLIDAVKWAVDTGVTTPDKIAIMGGSYGGYATLVGLTFTPDTFACGVDIVGPSNLETLLNTIPPYWASFFEQFAKRVGDPRTEDGKKLLNERSPLNYVEKIEKPLLIGQGANDPRVKQSESDQIVKAMQTKEIPVTYVLFPDEGHGFARPENRLAFNAVAEAFLGECLGGRVQPIGGDFAGSSISIPEGAGGVSGLQAAIDSHKPESRK